MSLVVSCQGDICMHLTNYAINKRNENFVQDDTMGSKRYWHVRALQEHCLGTLVYLSFPGVTQLSPYHLLFPTQEAVHPECLDGRAQL